MIAFAYVRNHSRKKRLRRGLPQDVKQNSTTNNDLASKRQEIINFNAVRCSKELNQTPCAVIWGFECFRDYLRRLQFVLTGRETIATKAIAARIIREVRSVEVFAILLASLCLRYGVWCLPWCSDTMSRNRTLFCFWL